MSIKHRIGEAAAEHHSSSKCVCTVGMGGVILEFVMWSQMTTSYLNNGTLTVKVRIKPEVGDFCQNFIPENPFVQNMLQLFLDEKIADMSFKLESQQLTHVTQGRIFHARGCTGEFSKKKIFSKTFSSQYNVVDMVCHMNIHHERFWKKSFSCVRDLFLTFFFTS